MTTTRVGRRHPTRSLRWSCLNCGSRNLPMRDGIMSSEARPTRGTGVSPRKRLTICAIGEPDSVHVQNANSLYGWAAGLLGCRPLVVTVMGGDVLFEEQGSPTPIGKWLTLELLRKADYITSKSHHLTEIIDGFGGFADKTERILWGVPVETFRRVDASSLRQLLGIVAQRRVILSPKILRPLYRVDLD